MVGKIFRKKFRTTGRRFGRIGKSRRHRRRGTPWYGHVTNALTHASGWGGPAMAALRGLWDLKKMINVEYKVFDTTNTGVSVTNGGTLYNFNGIAEGDDQGQRNGRSIKATSIYFRGACAISSAATASIVRLIFFVDTTGDAGTPAITDILNTASYLSSMNIATQAGTRFHVLKDFTMSMSNQGRQITAIKLFKKLAYHLKYTGSLNTNVGKNAIYLLAIGSESVNFPAMTIYSRLRYVDN